MISYLRRGKPGWLFAGLCLALPLVLSGCVVNYSQRGKTQADFDRDKAACTKIAEQTYSQKGTRVCDEVDACLKARGWAASSPTLW